MLWTNSIKSKATGIALGASSLGIHLHPALLLEGRSEFLSHNSNNNRIYNHFPLLPTSHRAICNTSSVGNQLYLREPCDAGEILALIPNTAVINLRNLQRRGILGDCTFNIKRDDPSFATTTSPVAGLSLFGSKFLGGGEGGAENCELVWRLAVEIAASSCLGHVSPWWHWIDSVKEEMISTSSEDDEYFLLQHEALRHLDEKFPPMLRQGYFSDAVEAVSRGRDSIFKEVMLQTNAMHAVVPNLRAWNLAFEAFRLRSVLTMNDENKSQNVSFSPSILPIIDLCAHAHKGAEEFRSNVVISMIDKESTNSNDANELKFNFPSWVSEQQKQEIYQDVQDEKNWRDDLRFADEPVEENNSTKRTQKKSTSSGPRKPLTLHEKMEKQMLFQSSSSNRRNQNNRTGRSRRETNRNRNISTSMSNNKHSAKHQNDVDYYYALESTRPCRAGEILRLDWFELSPGPVVVGNVSDEDEGGNNISVDETNQRKLMADFSKALFMWQRFKVAVP